MRPGRITHGRILQKMINRHYPCKASKVIFWGAGRVSNGGWLRIKTNKWSKDTMYNVCHRLWIVDDNDGGNTTKGIATTASYTGLPGCIRHVLLTLIILYHHSTRNFESVVFSAVAFYPTKRMLWDSQSVPHGVSFPRDDNGTLMTLPKLNI